MSSVLKKEQTVGLRLKEIKEKFMSSLVDKYTLKINLLPGKHEFNLWQRQCRNIHRLNGETKEHYAGLLQHLTKGV